MSDKFCHDYGDNPACVGAIDERFTMDFTDVEAGCFFYWCRVCGPIAHQMQAGINKAFAERDGFTEEFAAAIDKALTEQREGSS